MRYLSVLLLAALAAPLVVSYLATESVSGDVSVTPRPEPALSLAPEDALEDLGSLEYTLQPGDTLLGVARLFDVSVDDLLEHNAIADPGAVPAGLTLSVPLPAESSPPSSADAPDIERALREAEREFDLPSGLLLAVAWRESTWQQDAVSSAGAIGIAQVLPSTAEWVQETLLEEERDWRGSARDNAYVAAAYLRFLLDRADGDVWWALAAYYQGWRGMELDGPVGATSGYVRSVLELVPRFQ